MTLDIFNATSRTTAGALLDILKRAFSRGFNVVAYMHHDPIATRHARTTAGAIEGELYADGSGLEVAILGRVLVLGAEARHR
jgi:hypothetical protein